MVTHIIPIGFHAKQIYNPVKKYGGQKVIFITSNAKDSDTKKKTDDALVQAKKVVDGPLSIEYEEISFKNDYDFEERVEAYKKIFESENELVVNITGGPRFDSFILYLVALKYPYKVKDIVYIREDIGELISFPRFVHSGSLTGFEIELIGALKKQPLTLKELSKRLGKKLPQITKYVTSLEQQGILISERSNEGRKTRLAYSMF